MFVGSLLVNINVSEVGGAAPRLRDPGVSRLFPKLWFDRLMAGAAVTLIVAVTVLTPGELTVSVAEMSAGHPEEARRILDRLTRIAKHEYAGPVNLAAIYVAMGNNDEALLWLHSAMQTGDGAIVW
jgi:hypothetical protein